MVLNQSFLQTEYFCRVAMKVRLAVSELISLLINSIQARVDLNGRLNRMGRWAAEERRLNSSRVNICNTAPAPIFARPS